MKKCPRCGYSIREVSLESVRQHYPNAFRAWTPDEDRKLKQSFDEKKDILEIAVALGRQPTAVQTRLIKLGFMGAAPAPKVAEEQPEVMTVPESVESL